MKIINKKIPDKVSAIIIIGSIILVLFLGFFAYNQRQRVEKLELKLEVNRQLQERVIQAMKQESMLEDFINLKGLTKEEREQIKDYVNQIKNKEKENAKN